MIIREYRELFMRGYGRYKPQIAAMILFGLMSALAESVGITILIPLFSKIAEGGADFAQGNFILAPIFSSLHIGTGFKILLPFIVAAFILKSALLFFANYFSASVGENYTRDARKELVSFAFGANWPFLLRQKIGYLETILIKDVDVARALFIMLSQAAINAVSLGVYILIALSVSYEITLLSLVIGLFLFLVLKHFLYKIKELSYSAARLYSGTMHDVSEHILGMKVIKTSSAEEIAARKVAQNFQSLRDINVRLKFLQEISHALYEPIGIIFVVGIFAFLFISKNFEIGVFAAVMYLVHRIFTYTLGIQSALYKINEHIPFLKRLVEFRDEMACHKERDTGGRKFALHNALEFRDIEFAYNKEQKVLNGVTFAVKNGEMAGIVGKSGSGKTTIVDLLLRLFEPTSGRILLDGIDISDISISDWRMNISYVAQDVFLINDTIANNIRFYHDGISDRYMEGAAKAAYIYDFIQKQPQGFGTQVGDRGILLSGGEKQRIVLARALARQPKILVLDEATSALDNESELMIQRALNELKGKITIIVIAHRLTTLLSCDRILFLEDGKIKEEGSPQELLKDKDSHFFQLYNIRNTHEA